MEHGNVVSFVTRPGSHIRLLPHRWDSDAERIVAEAAHSTFHKGYRGTEMGGFDGQVMHGECQISNLSLTEDNTRHLNLSEPSVISVENFPIWLPSMDLLPNSVLPYSKPTI